MGLKSWFAKNVFRPIHKAITNNRENIVGVLDFVSGGAISRQEQRQEDIREAEKKARFMEESNAKDWSQTQRQAAIAAQQAGMDADAVGEQSRAASIDQFQAESAALADSGLGGISEGSPYMATQASLSEMDRSLRNWFSKSSDSIAMTGENTAMSIENARFRKKEGEANLETLRNNINDMKEADNGLNMALDFFGGFLSTASSLYSIGTAVGGVALDVKANWAASAPASGPANNYGKAGRDASSSWGKFKAGVSRVGSALGGPIGDGGMMRSIQAGAAFNYSAIDGGAALESFYEKQAYPSNSGFGSNLLQNSMFKKGNGLALPGSSVLEGYSSEPLKPANNFGLLGKPKRYDQRSFMQ